MILTYRYRLKDGNTAKKLKSMAGAVNFVWNYTAQIHRENWKRSRKYTNKYDLRPLTKGASRDLPINSQTIQAVTDEFATSGASDAKGTRPQGWIAKGSPVLKTVVRPDRAGRMSPELHRENEIYAF